MSNDFQLPPDWFIRKLEVTQLAEMVDWSQNQFGLPEAWAVSRGSGVRVAVLDTGVDSNHPDLRGAIQAAVDFTGSRFGHLDKAGHGTWCCGHIGARTNGIGVIGMAPECKLYSAKVLNDQGAGNEDWILRGFEWAAAQNVDIISMSLGGPSLSTRLQDAIRSFTASPGRYVIAAAGNDGHIMGNDTMGYPAKWPETVAVAAVGKDGNLTKFSSYGNAVTIAAPGYEMVATIPVEQGSYGAMSGTSMATPFVAGVTALAIAKHRNDAGDTPLSSTTELKEHLQKTATIVRDDELNRDIRVIAPVRLVTESGKPLPPVNRKPTGLVVELLKAVGFTVHEPARAGDAFSVVG